MLACLNKVNILVSSYIDIASDVSLNSSLNQKLDEKEVITMIFRDNSQLDLLIKSFT